MGRLQAIERNDRGKAPVCHELVDKLQRYLTGGWMPDSTTPPFAVVGGAALPQAHG
jgi:hypothetical protein